MKKFTLISIFTFVFFAFISYVLAQVPSPSPVLFPTPDPSRDTIPVLLSLISLGKGWSSLGLYAGLAAGIKALYELLNLSLVGAPLSKVPEKYKLLVLSGVGFVLVLLGFLAAGMPALASVSAALGSAAGAGFVHEILADFFPKA